MRRIRSGSISAVCTLRTTHGMGLEDSEDSSKNLIADYHDTLAGET